MYFPRVAGFVALAALVPAVMAAPAPVSGDVSAPAASASVASPAPDASPAPVEAAAPPASTPAPDSNANDSQPPAPAPDSNVNDSQLPAPAPDSNVDDSQSTSTPPTSSKIVSGLNCTDFQVNGTLQMNGRPLSFTGMPVTLNMADKGDDIVFIECPSETMGYKPSGSSHYGILSPVAAPTSQCVRASQLGEPQAPLEIQDCSMSDDSSQMGQIFQYDDDSHSLAFVGRPAPSDFYQLNLVNDTVAAVSPHGDPVASLKLV